MRPVLMLFDEATSALNPELGEGARYLELRMWRGRVAG
jgi:ABC-type polar amino acid transport system ATPase subunit